MQLKNVSVRSAPLFGDVRGADALIAPATFADPLDLDDRADRAMATSYRRVGRVVMLAAEVGARFQRERIDHDAAAWIHAPRALFGRRPAIAACMDRVHFTRAMLLPGLGLGLDAEPEDIDALVEGAGCGVVLEGGDAAQIYAGSNPGPANPALFTAVVFDVSNAGSVFAFHARVTGNRGEFEAGLRERIGGRLFGKAVIREGYDASDPIVSASVSDAIDDMLVQVVDDPGSPLARGLDIVIEQRFAD